MRSFLMFTGADAVAPTFYLKYTERGRSTRVRFGLTVTPKLARGMINSAGGRDRTSSYHTCNDPFLGKPGTQFVLSIAFGPTYR